jgi:hypothetical protein
MHLPHLTAYDAYAQPAGATRKDKFKTTEFEPFFVGSALEKPDGGGSFAGSSRDREAAEPEMSPFEEVFAFAPADPSPESDAPMPEDAHDAQDLCAMLEAAAKG